MGNLTLILSGWPEQTEEEIIRLCLCHTIFINFQKHMYYKQKNSIPASYCQHFFSGAWFAKSSLNSIGLPQGSPRRLKSFL